jgi:hypothetical protein
MLCANQCGRPFDVYLSSRTNCTLNCSVRQSHLIGSGLNIADNSRFSSPFGKNRRFPIFPCAGDVINFQNDDDGIWFICVDILTEIMWLNWTRSVPSHIGGWPWRTFTSFGIHQSCLPQFRLRKGNPARAADRGGFGTRTGVHSCVGHAVSGRNHSSVPHAGIELRACDGRFGRTEQAGCRSPSVLGACPASERVSCRKDACQAEAGCRFCLSRFIAPIRSTREFLITSSMLTTMRNSHHEASRPQEPTPRLHPQLRTHWQMPSHIFTRLGLVYASSCDRYCGLGSGPGTRSEWACR